ncbi:serine/threonine-protein kinase [Thalassoglobus sp. JC818]|uniref:serine/threonine protein kinase n=1 Tax=Thalassoglobus sp. JC818 TaxID=3232136 RepID=UPI00345B4211
MAVLSSNDLLAQTISSDCPSDQELTCLLNDQLAIDIKSRIEQHVESCERCQQWLELAASCDLVDSHQWSHPESSTDSQTSSVIHVVEKETPNWNVIQNRETSPERLNEMRIQDRILSPSLFPSETSQLEVINVLGEGGMAVVFLCHDELSDRELAVKVLRHRYVTDYEARERFLHEAEIQSRLLGQGVPEVFQWGELIDGRSFIVMEYWPGVTVSESFFGEMRQETSTREILFLMHQVCEIVARAHANGVVHRDLKPSNFLIDQDGQVAVLDWGLAKNNFGPSQVFDSSADSAFPRSITNLCRSVVGTPGYSAPEQVSGNTIEPTADVYSLGVILAELLAGERIKDLHRSFHTPDENYNNSERIVSELIAAGVSGSLVQMIRCCLNSDPQQRFTSAKEMADCLAQLLRTYNFSEICLVARARRHTSAPMTARTIRRLLNPRNSSAELQ